MVDFFSEKCSGTTQMNTHSGPRHVNTWREVVFHATSGAEFLGPASIYI